MAPRNHADCVDNYRNAILGGEIIAGGGGSRRETVGSEILRPQEMHALKVSCLERLKPGSCKLAARLRVALHLQPKYE
jgi:hypothetical protein